MATKSELKRLDKLIKDELKAFAILCYNVIEDEGWTYEEIYQRGGPSPNTTSRLINLEHTRSPLFGTCLRLGVILKIKCNWERTRRNIIKFQSARRAA